ncbi:hypothetical protein GCM10017786_48560 [Amycolatopsis deserti]|uniref:Uncharacterized protein n=1 Tax=Amycolatopsis deserti TaxID=185696 RepID=A0ABQ3J8T4_9PSEU|nr:hypothetical protein [Amycolatopsis deserti]GHF09335.1 hypothetical protein GCM10017786_48560 [Amycolatopsis deserti]
MDSTQQRVLAYEPHPGEPAATDSLEVEIIQKQRSRLINSMVVYVVAAGLLLALDTDPASAAFAAFLAVATVYQSWLLFFRVLPGRKLLAYPSVLLTPGPGQLLVAGSKVSVVLPGPEPRWLVVRLPESKRILLAGLRRVYFIGPDPRGRVLVALPGGINGRFGRITTEPAPGSVEPPVPPRAMVAALRDPVVTTFLREVWRRSWGMAGFFVLLAAVLWTVNLTYFDLPYVSTFVTVLAVLYAVLGLMMPVRTATLSTAVKEQPWQELHATLDTEITPGASGGTGKAEGRVMLADGTARVLFQRVPLDLLVNVRDTQRLWVLGTPERGRKAVAGLPGYPVLGLVNLR